jgi:guanylate kinase
MNKIVIICGPSASGKNTIIDSLFADGNYKFLPVVTNTTRPKRATDVEGKIYHFLSDSEFKQKIDQSYFLEYENTHGFFYGTAKESFDRSGNYLMQSDIRGALSIKRAFPECLIIFINLPVEQIINRLKDRGETDDRIDRRLKTAKREFEMIHNADVIIDNLNGSYDQALNNVKTAIDKFLSIG